MSTTPPPDGVVNLLSQDHQSAEQRLDEFMESDPEARPELFWKLTDELVRHEVAEEVVVYPAVRKLGRDSIANARIAEQSEAEEQLARMEKLEPSAPEFMAEFTDLRAAVLEHAKREESEVFSLLANAPSELQVELGQRYQTAKRAAPTTRIPMPRTRRPATRSSARSPH